MKPLDIALLALLISRTVLSLELPWQVETTRSGRVDLDLYHGETATLAPTLLHLGTPLDLSGATARFLWQTNGMDTSWFVAPATVSSATVRADFTPSMDTGSHRVTFFFDIQTPAGKLYRANGVLRLKTSPGFEPNHIEIPPRLLDLAAVTVTTSPFADAEATSAALNEARNLAQNAQSTANGILSYMTAQTNLSILVTNYLSASGEPPSLSIRERLDGEETIIWDETLNLDLLETRTLERIDRLERTIPSPAWATTASMTGQPMPSNTVTWISTPETVFSAGFEWEKHLSAKGSAFWVLASKRDPLSLAAATNSTALSLADFEGNPILSIDKTDSYLADAIPASTDYDSATDTFSTRWSTVSETHPILYASYTLAAADAKAQFIPEDDPACPVTVSWSGTSGDWVSTARPKTETDALFVYAKIEIQGRTILKAQVPIHATAGIAIPGSDGKLYTLTVESGQLKIQEAKE